MKESLLSLLAVCLLTATGYTAPNREDYELQRTCALDAKRRFDLEFKDNPAPYYTRVLAEDGTQRRNQNGELQWNAQYMPYVYENHFNRAMNRCFMYVSAGLAPVRGYLFDVNEVAPLAEIELVQDLQKPWGGHTFACFTKGGDCDSKDTFTSFIKPYMED